MMKNPFPAFHINQFQSLLTACLLRPNSSLPNLNFRPSHPANSSLQKKLSPRPTSLEPPRRTCFSPVRVLPSQQPPLYPPEPPLPRTPTAHTLGSRSPPRVYTQTRASAILLNPPSKLIICKLEVGIHLSAIPHCVLNARGHDLPLILMLSYDPQLTSLDEYFGKLIEKKHVCAFGRNLSGVILGPSPTAACVWVL